MEKFDQNNFVQNEPAQLKSPKTVWIVIITAIVVAILVGVGVYMLQLQRVKNLEKQLSKTNETLKALASKSVLVKDNNATTTNNSNIITVTTTKNTDETVSWQTYKNTKYGFEFKYPNKDYQVLTDSTNLYGWPNSIALLFSTKPGVQSYSASIAIFDKLEDYKKSPNGYNDKPSFYLFINGKYISFDYWNDNEAEIMKKIISTLKISSNTTTNSTTTSGLPSFLSNITPATYSTTWRWETYNDSQFNYSINFPGTTPALWPKEGTAQPITTLATKDEGFVYRTASYGAGLSISVLTNNSSLDIYSWMTRYKSLNSSLMSDFTNSETKYIVDGKPALRYYYNGSPQTYPISKIFFANGKYSYVAQCSHNSYDQSKVASTEKTCLEILSTLKFSN